MTMLKPKEMAERLGVTVRTLQIWDSKGVLKAYRTPTNRRYYTDRLSGLRKYKHKLENDKSLKGGENDGVKNPKSKTLSQ